MNNNYDEIDISDMMVIYEAARFALADDNVRGEIKELLSLSDQHLHEILIKVEKHLHP